MKMLRATYCIALAMLVFLTGGVARGQYSAVHTFTGPDGIAPEAGVTLFNSVIYGTTSSGGPVQSNSQGIDIADGTIFSMNPDGSNYAVLHEFTGGTSNGAFPNTCGVTVAGSVIYGMAIGGGSHNNGAIYKMNIDGSGFTLLHSFAFSSSTDGFQPSGDLILSGSTLYGTTSRGGAESDGTIFKINTDGTGFAVLHSFGGVGTDGSVPMAGLTLSGSALYGTTRQGGIGSNSAGTVFTINTDGTGYSVLHSFPYANGTYPDGSHPMAGLTISDSTLYGTTFQGAPTSTGSSGEGTIFKMNTDGTGFSVMHVFGAPGQGFDGSAADGGAPESTMYLSGSTLNGTTTGGGNVNFGYGTLFQINTDGTGYGQLHVFTENSTGLYPEGDLARLGPTVYGTTQGDLGSGSLVYADTVPEPSSALLGLLAIDLIVVLRCQDWRRRISRQASAKS